MSVGGDLSVFGAELRRWREHRRFSQERLAERSEVSQRHLSFLENGRTRPSPEMVEHLAIALDVPLRGRNGLLMSAGFAPTHASRPFDGEALAHIRQSLETLITAQEPYPAFVIDKGWTLLLANAAARRLTSTLLAPSTPPLLSGNILHMLLHPEGVRSSIINWEETAAVLVNRLRAECDADPFDAELRQLLEEALAYPDVSEATAGVGGSPSSDIVTEIRFRMGADELRLYTAIMLLSDAADITVSELRIELLLPADEQTAEALRSFAAGPTAVRHTHDA